MDVMVLFGKLPRDMQQGVVEYLEYPVPDHAKTMRTLIMDAYKLYMVKKRTI
jgi:hypothetical protein